jgi:uracil-DNA glycosylase family 4
MHTVERSQLVELAATWSACQDCRLAGTRTQVVVGDGNPDADLMFVGEAPGFHEDQQGIPFVGQAGKLLDELLAGIGLTRADCYIANVLKCRPPGNRDPLDDEIEACQDKLTRQVELVRPRVIATLGNFATKLLSGRSMGVTRVHGQARRASFGSHDTVLYPLYHPAAALYNARLRPELEADLARIPALLRHLDGLDSAAALEPPPTSEPLPAAALQREAEPQPELVAAGDGGEQLGLF